MLTDQDVTRIAEAVVQRLNKTDVDTVSMEKAAEILGIAYRDMRSLSSRFSMLCNPKYTKSPLACVYVGRQRVFYKSDLERFMKSRRRG